MGYSCGLTAIGRGKLPVEAPSAYETFGIPHLLTMAALLLGGAVMVGATRRWATLDQAKSIGAGIALFMLAQELFDRGYHVYLGDDFWGHVLPLQMCGASVFLTIALLLTRNYRIFQLLYFWGLGGAGVAILTPDIQYPFPHVLNITYFTSHALIIVGVAYMMANFGYRPTLGSLGGTILFSNLYMAAMFPLNALLGTNFLFVSEKPPSLSLLDFMGPWPWYVLGMELVGIAVFCLLYAPYLVMDYFKASSVAPQAAEASGYGDD